MQIDVNTTIENQLAVFTLSREKALNSLTHDMIKTIHCYADKCSRRDDISFLFFPPLQQKVYCAGGDIRWLYQQGKAGLHEKQMAFFADEYRLDYAIGQSSKPVLAIIDGFLIGGGMGLLMPAKSRYATESACFAMPETGIGFFPDVGMTYRLNQCPGYTGMYLALTGQRINAHEACYLGLVEGVLSDDDANRIQNMARENKDSPNLYNMVKAMLADKASSQDEHPIAAYQQQIDDVFSGDSVNSIMEKLMSMSGTWAEQTLKQLKNACPLSLSITFDLMHKVRNHDQAYSYQLDYTVAYHFMHSRDFYEGIRAQIIEKDRTPQWQYAHVNEIPQSVIEQFFKLPGGSLSLKDEVDCSASEIATDH